MLDRLAQLRDIVANAAMRERDLEQDFQRRALAEARRHETALAEEASRLDREQAEEAEAHRQRCQRHLVRTRERKERIVQAHRNARKRALDRIEMDEGQVKYTVQKGVLETERFQKDAVAANDSRLARSRGRLAQVQEGLTACESAVCDTLRGYPGLRRKVGSSEDAGAIDPTVDAARLLDECEGEVGRAHEGLGRMGRLWLPRLFCLVPFWLILPGLTVGWGFLALWLSRGPVPGFGFAQAGIALAASLVLVVGVSIAGKRQIAPLARVVAGNLARARRLHAGAAERATAFYQAEAGRIEAEVRQRLAILDEHWHQAVAEAAKRRDSWPALMDHKATVATSRHESMTQRRLERLDRAHADAVAARQSASQARRAALTRSQEKKRAGLAADRAQRWQALEQEWRGTLQALYQEIESANAAADRVCPDWSVPSWATWMPPSTMPEAARFGRLEIDVPLLAGSTPQDSRLSLPGPRQLSLPLALAFPAQGSLLIETSKAGSDVAGDTLNNLILRLLSLSPPGKVSFTIIDPVRLGQNFAGIMHLADFEESLVDKRIWTQPGEIDQRLADLNEHMEKVIQMYLRNEYPTIAEYNRDAGNIAEKYHMLVIADFPVNFSENAIRRLVNIASSGARCGVFTLIHWDRRQALPPEFVLDELRRNSVGIVRPAGAFLLAGPPLPGTQLHLDVPPPAENVTAFLQRVGHSSQNANRVEVPFAHVAPAASERWSLDSAEEIRVPIGRSGATKLQTLALGRATRQHALIAGKTGSGKSTLFHVLITNLAFWYGPDQVEFYLVDFKKGVEFKCYATHRLPHARVVAIESDREFGLSVLQRMDDELRRRGDLFRQAGVQDLAGYRRSTGSRPVPRALLIVDEFQEFFVEDDRVSQTAAVLLDRIVRQGRAFGIHVLLGSQTLGGAYTLARATLGQMVIRIALQCNEADAYLIMDEGNPAPRLLSRPGEGIYNDMGGATEGNSPFQTVWLPEEERDSRLEEIHTLASDRGRDGSPPFVFEGNAPGDLRENVGLRQVLGTPPVEVPAVARLWLGAPNSIKGPTEAVFRRQSGHNLVVISQRDESALAVLALGLVGLSAQFPAGCARFVFINSTPPDSPQHAALERMLAVARHPVTVVRAGEIAGVLDELGLDLQQRAEGAGAAAAPATFLFILGLQNFKRLRQEDEFSFGATDDSPPSPARRLAEILAAGPAAGVHTVVACDTYNNLSRFLGRKALGEFELRVLFQMSANDSASLIDNPKANALGLHRALLYNEHEGYLETFRPYAVPDGTWFEETSRALGSRPKQSS
jgi:hypothetical protein